MLIGQATAAVSQPIANPIPPTTTASTTASTTAPTATTTTTTTTLPIRAKPSYVDDPHGERQQAAAYAYRWAATTNPGFALSVGGRITVPSDNPDAKGRAIETRSLVELDCTSFMSQALRSAGFAYTSGWGYNATKRTATTAWVRASGPEGLAATFVRLGRMRVMSPTGTVHGEPPPAGIQIGDIIVWDLNGNTKRIFIDHQLMVTEVSAPGSNWGDIRVSYHTYDHTNRAMDEYQDFVALDAPKARLYVFHVNYAS